MALVNGLLINKKYQEIDKMKGCTLFNALTTQWPCIEWLPTFRGRTMNSKKKFASLTRWKRVFVMRKTWRSLLSDQYYV